MNTRVWYHRDADGFCAAFAAWLYFGGNKIKPNIKFTGVQYNEPVPRYDEGDHIVILDFSYPREILNEINSKTKMLQVIDHHAKTCANLTDLPYLIYDINKSGCVLAFEHFFPGIPIPDLFSYVQDRDLWKFELPDSRAINEGIQSLKWVFEVWNNYLEDETFSSLVANGKVLLQSKRDTVERLTQKYITGRLISAWGAGDTVPIINSCLYTSEIGEVLAKGAKYAVIWFQRSDGKFVYSLRSSKESGTDVAEIAAEFGGGGHPQAAGFVVETLTHDTRS